MLNEWELKNGLKTIHINIKSKEEALAKLENGEIDCFISLEEPSWADKDVSIITRIGKSNIYFAINKDHPEIKKSLILSCTSWRRNGHFICQICTGNIFHRIIHLFFHLRKIMVGRTWCNSNGIFGQ